MQCGCQCGRGHWRGLCGDVGTGVGVTKKCEPLCCYSFESKVRYRKNLYHTAAAAVILYSKIKTRISESPRFNSNILVFTALTKKLV